MPQSSGRALSWALVVVAGAALTLVAAGCSGGKKGVDDQARVDTCTLTGATTNDGCDLAGGVPAIQLGDLTMGALKTREVALYNGGAGAVPATISQVTFDGGAAPTTNYAILKIFKLDATQQEVAVTLPFDLAVNHGGELRVRVAYTANAPIGAVSGVSLKVVASHPAVTTLLPITGQITGCPTGMGDCDGDPSNGCEVDLQTTLSSCGACGTACGETNAAAACVAGTCQLTCAAGFGNCDGNAANGCETDLSTTPADCGACGTTCGSINGIATCSSSTCGIVCSAGFADCDGSLADGCEVNLAGDVANCGTCGNICGALNAAPFCTGGSCGFTCNAGFLDCNGLPGDGCEVNVNADPSNCGACGSVCAPANATGACSAGTCSVAACTGAFKDCNGLVADGCEVDTASSPSNCGACGNVCSLANATAGCAAGACTVATCSGSFRDCNGIAPDGCETDVATSLANCGACGAVCSPANASSACVAGGCNLTACAAGWYDMNGLINDGCECPADSNPDVCASAGAMGSVALGGTISVSGSLLPLSRSEYFTVSFPSNDSLTYHPKITVTSPSGIARFDVLVDCGGAAAGSCGLEGGGPLSMTSWETYYTGGDPGAYWGVFNRIPPPGTGGTVTIRVFAAGSTTSCGTFTLTVSN